MCAPPRDHPHCVEQTAERRCLPRGWSPNSLNVNALPSHPRGVFPGFVPAAAVARHRSDLPSRGCESSAQFADVNGTHHIIRINVLIENKRPRHGFYLLATSTAAPEAVTRSRSCCSIQKYVDSRPVRSGSVGFQPSFSQMRRLSELRPRTPRGPSIWRIRSCLPEMSMAIDASWLIVTISSDPMLTGPTKSEAIRRWTPSRHSSIYKNGSRSLLSSARPGALWSEDIVEAGDSDGYAVIPHERQVQSLAEQLLPAILAVRRRRVRGIFRTVGPLGIALIALGVNACR